MQEYRTLKKILRIVPIRKLASKLFPSTHTELIEEFIWNDRLHQWAKEFDPVHLKDRYELYDYVNNEIVRDEPITYLEFGVWKGKSLSYWSRLNTHPETKFYGFDSFEGLPEDWSVHRNTAFHNLNGEVPQIEDARVELIKGWFQNTIPNFLTELNPTTRIIVNNDSDLYSSTLYCLTQLNRLLKPGTIIIFDEFCVAAHEFRAFYDYAHAYRRDYKVLAIAGNTPYEKAAIAMC